MDRVEGWIKLHRKLQEKAIWQCATPEQKAILITILLNINSDKKEWEWQGKQFTCEPGQMVTSLASLAEKCGKGVSIKNVRTALEKFEKYGFLTNQSAKTGRLITVVNWAFYQDSSYEVANQSANSRQSYGKEVATNKNNKNNKNKKNIKYMCAFEEFWKVYPRKKEKANAYKCYKARLNDGFSEEELLRAAKAYAKECEEKHTEEKYIKHGSTFLSANIS